MRASPIPALEKARSGGRRNAACLSSCDDFLKLRLRPCSPARRRQRSPQPHFPHSGGSVSAYYLASPNAFPVQFDWPGSGTSMKAAARLMERPLIGCWPAAQRGAPATSRYRPCSWKGLLQPGPQVAGKRLRSRTGLPFTWRSQPSASIPSWDRPASTGNATGLHKFHLQPADHTEDARLVAEGTPANHADLVALGPQAGVARLVTARNLIAPPTDPHRYPVISKLKPAASSPPPPSSVRCNPRPSTRDDLQMRSSWPQRRP